MKRQLKFCKLDEETNVLSSDLDTVAFEDEHLAEFLLKQFKLNQSKKYLTEARSGRSMTFGEVSETSLRVASMLIDQLDLQIGDVAFGYSANSIMYACCIYGAIFAGVTFTGCIWTLTQVDLTHQLNDSGAKVVFCVQNNIDTLFKCLHQCSSIKTVVLLDSIAVDVDTSCCPDRVAVRTLTHLLEGSSLNDPRIPRTSGLDKATYTAFLHYSSGSTGMPKGVKRSGHSLIAICYSIGETGTFFGKPGQTVSCFQSLVHGSGTFTMVLTLFNGCHVILMDELTPENLLNTIAKYRVNTSLIPPTMLQVLSKMELVDQVDLSSLKVVSTGGAALPTSIVDPFLCKFKSLRKLYNVYGISEAGVPISTPEDCDNLRAIGSPLRGVQVKVVDRDNNRSLGFDETGEIWIKSIQNASGYLNRPDAEAETFTPDGWCRTGDAGYFDQDGLVYIVERFKEMIKVDMFQVAPAEIESILCSHPGVSQACVVATPHAVTGETPRAFVVPKDHHMVPDEEELLQFVNGQLVKFKQIRGGLFFVASLPTIMLGKVNRVVLKKNPSQLTLLKEPSVPL